MAPESSYYSIWQNIRNCFNKAIAIDFVEAKALKVRAFEVNRGDTSKALKEATKVVRDVKRTKDLEKAKERALDILETASAIGRAARAEWGGTQPPSDEATPRPWWGRSLAFDQEIAPQMEGPGL